MSPRRSILRSFQSPGDILMLTAAVRDLHRAHPGKFQTDVRTSAPALWENNPYLTPLNEGDADVERIDMHYPLIHESNRRPYHFIHGYVQYLEERLGVKIPVTHFAGDIHLSADEQRAPSPLAALGHEGPFWIVMAGGKYDFTAKWWNPASFQAVVDHFRPGKVLKKGDRHRAQRSVHGVASGSSEPVPVFQQTIQFVQCGEAGHFHPPLAGVINLVGKTSLREFIVLMHHAAGVLCPVTFAMHLAAAVPVRGNREQGIGNREQDRGNSSAGDGRRPPTLSTSQSSRSPIRPCVVVAGGREPPHWEQYPGHQFLHTIGALDCCATGGCWRSRCQLAGDGDAKDRQHVCQRPVQVTPELRIAQCMEMIEPGDVIRAIELYEGNRQQGIWKEGNREQGVGKEGNREQGTGNRFITLNQEETMTANLLATQADNPKSKIENPQSNVSVLIDFRHGLGDAVQLTSVLLHLRHYHPDWEIDVAAGVGKLPGGGNGEQGAGKSEGESGREGETLISSVAPEVSRLLLLPLYRRMLVRGRDRIDRGTYAHVFELAWDECPTSYADSPSTKAEYCLRSVFHLEPIPELCRYELAISDDAMAKAKAYLESICGPGGFSLDSNLKSEIENPKAEGRFPVVLLHYQANTSTEKKDLSHELARKLCEKVLEAGYVPVILDWDNRSPLPDGSAIFNPGADHPLWGGIGTGNCEVLAALIAQSSLFIGVDSGPLHVAGARVGFAIPTPSIAVWTGHHPLHYFGLADHVTHLVPEDHASRLRGDRKVGQEYFQKHYDYRTYQRLDDALPALVQERLARGNDGLLRTHGFWVRGDNVEQDLVIVRDIAEDDSYRIAELDVPGPIAIDVGAHIGVFSTAFKRRHPSARIIAVECCPENIVALTRNVGGFAAIVPAACTYQREPLALLNAVYPGCVSTGGSRVVERSELEDGLPGPSSQGDVLPAPSSVSEYWLDGRPLKTVTLEDLMTEYGLGRIDVLKLDCEGSEFSILENTASLDRIGAIVGEYHGRERFLRLVARRFADWRLRIVRDGDPGTFWLVRPSNGNSLSRRAAIPTPAGSNDDATQPQSTDANGLSVDVARGMAFQVDRSRPRDYNDAYFQKYLDYEGTALSSRLGRLRTSLVKKHCRTVLDIGIGCGTFLKQWAIMACGCGCREPSAEIGKPKEPCAGCGQAGLPGAAHAARQAQVHGYGYDINPQAVSWLKERALFVDPYDSIPPEIEGLTFWDSLEHLPKPANLLARLRVGMFAFVSLPIFSDLARLAESKHYRPGEHFYYFTHDGLRRFMADQGFDCLHANRDESRAGRESIETFVFRKTRGPRLPANWHRRAMGNPLREIEPQTPLTLRAANGIGDLCWLMTLAGPLKRRLNIPKLTLELQLAGDHRDNRALEFARRFSDVDEVTSARFDIHLRPVAADARLRYVPNGYSDSTKRAYTLIVNPWLEWQGRLENFLPEIEPQWDVLAAGYRRDPAEIATAADYSRPGRLFDRPRTGHICIHLCSRADNTTSGMNRGGLWSLDDWTALLERLRTITDLPIYILGAQDDVGYAGELMQRARRVPRLYDACGTTSTTLAIEILRQSSLMVSFASGLAVAACYLGVPTVAFWRAEGQSVSASDDYWYAESFATNWVPPAMLASGLYYAAVYGHDNAEIVFAAIQRMLIASLAQPELV